jgi:electron transfer flavoprotein beta subunit
VKIIVAVKQVPVRDSPVRIDTAGKWMCAGPERAGQTVREALVKGVGRAIHLSPDNLVSLDTLALGLQSDDPGLSIRPAAIVMQIEIAGAGLRIRRELGDGWFQRVQRSKSIIAINET